MKLSNWFTPNETTRDGTVITALWVGVALGVWELLKPTVFPSPLEVVLSIPNMISEGLGPELFTSFMINMEALCLSALIGLPLAYLSRVPSVAPVAQGVAKLRFVGSAVFFLPLVLMTGSGHSVKVWLLTLGELFYLVTTMIGVVQNIPDFRFDDARTMKMSEWLSVWYVVIRGTVSEAIDALRDNAAMGWSMLMFVEGVVRSEGGVGVMLINMEKHVEWAAFFGIIIAILGVGILQDYVIGQIKKVVCPYV